MARKKVIPTKLLMTLAEDTLKSLLETIHNNLNEFGEYTDYVAIATLDEKDLPLYITEECHPLTRLIATHRLAGKSVWDKSLLDSLENMIEEASLDNRIPIDFDLGRFYTLYLTYEALGMKKQMGAIKPWAFWSPYD